jgi:hyperosmotically inducible protein
MKSAPRKLLLAAAIAAALAGTGTASATDTVAENLVEARQESQIWTTYALSPYLRAYELGVAVDAGRAVLTGTVDEEVNKDLAKQIALGVSGIKSVDNQIVVKADHKTKPQAADRSYGEMVDDSSITAAIKSQLLWSKHADGLKTDVDTQRGHVTLDGTADTPAAKQHAGRLARNTRGVVSVANRINVVPQKAGMADTAKAAGREARKDAADSWITTKVLSTLMYSDQVEGSSISVKTLAGNVTLSGKVDSGAERALAIELAQNVRGVKSVHAKSLTF